MSNDIHIAESVAPETYTPEQHRAGDGPFQTRNGVVASGQKLDQYAVVARNAAGKLVEWDPTHVVDPESPDAADGSENAIGVLAYAVDATDGDVECAYYWSGFFNTAALVWPEGATDAQKDAAFDGKPINHRALMYSVG